MKNSNKTIFKVIWNEEVYGKVKSVNISLQEFIKDGINGDWGIEEEGEFTLNHLINLDINNSFKVCSPYDWDILITRIK